MSRVTIFIPISRIEHAALLFASLEQLDCDRESTSLLTYVDGDNALFEHIRQLTESSKFANGQCVQRKAQPGQVKTYDVSGRRRRIAAIKNESKAFLPDCDYVFGVEDDTIVPPHALAQLLDDHAAYPHAGFIEGVELGRWGVPYVGAWHADDVYEPTRLTTITPGEGLEEIDAGGFYCYLVRRSLYNEFDYRPFGNNDLGPDVAFGLHLRQQGFHNYVDWRVQCDHRRRDGSVISFHTAQPRQVAVFKVKNSWHQKIEKLI